jgi:hypothetical protein
MVVSFAVKQRKAGLFPAKQFDPPERKDNGRKPPSVLRFGINFLRCRALTAVRAGTGIGPGRPAPPAKIGSIGLLLNKIQS